MTTKFTITRIANTIRPITKLPCMMKLPKASMTRPAAPAALVALGQDQARRGDVEREPQQGRDQQHRREGAELERLLDEQRGQQDQHREGDREASSRSSSRRRHRQDQHHEDADHAQRKRQVAMTERPGDPVEQPAGGEARGVRHDADQPGGRCSGRRAHGSAWAAARRRDRHTLVAILAQLVAQRADRDAEDVRCMGAIAERMVQRVEDQITLDVGDRASDQRGRASP